MIESRSAEAIRADLATEEGRGAIERRSPIGRLVADVESLLVRAEMAEGRDGRRLALCEEKASHSYHQWQQGYQGYEDWQEETVWCPGVDTRLAEARARVVAVEAQLAEIYADVEYVERAYLPRREDPLSDWGKGVAWMIDRLNAMRDDRAALASPPGDAVTEDRLRELIRATPYLGEWDEWAPIAYDRIPVMARMVMSHIYGRHDDTTTAYAHCVLCSLFRDADSSCTCGGRPVEIGGAEHRPGCGSEPLPEEEAIND